MNANEELMVKEALKLVLEVNQRDYNFLLVEASHWLNDALKFSQRDNPDPSTQ